MSDDTGVFLSGVLGMGGVSTFSESGVTVTEGGKVGCRGVLSMSNGGGGGGGGTESSLSGFSETGGNLPRPSIDRNQ